MEERNETSSQVLYENLKKWEETGAELCDGGQHVYA